MNAPQFYRHQLQRRRLSFLDRRRRRRGPSRCCPPCRSRAPRPAAARPPSARCARSACAPASFRCPPRRNCRSRRSSAICFGSGIEWFSLHQAALGVRRGRALRAASVSVLVHAGASRRPPRGPARPLEGLRAPFADKGCTGALSQPVLACATVAGAPSPPRRPSPCCTPGGTSGGGPVTYAHVGPRQLSGATVVGICTAGSVLTVLSRRRLLALAVAVTGVALLAMGLVPIRHVLALAALCRLRGWCRRLTGHSLVDRGDRGAFAPGHRAPAGRRPRRHRRRGPSASRRRRRDRPHRPLSSFVRPCGAAFTLMLVGALLLPVAALSSSPRPTTGRASAAPHLVTRCAAPTRPRRPPRPASSSP